MSYWKLKLMKNSIFKTILFICLFLINIEVFAKDLIIDGNQYIYDYIVIIIIFIILLSFILKFLIFFLVIFNLINQNPLGNFLIKTMVQSHFLMSIKIQLSNLQKRKSIKIVDLVLQN